MNQLSPPPSSSQFWYWYVSYRRSDFGGPRLCILIEREVDLSTEKGADLKGETSWVRWTQEERRGWVMMWRLEWSWFILTYAEDIIVVVVQIRCWFIPYASNGSSRKHFWPLQLTTQFTTAECQANSSLHTITNYIQSWVFMFKRALSQCFHSRLPCV